MIFASIFLIFIYLSIKGYSYFFINLSSRNIQIYDILYGLYFLIFISLLLNFFFSLQIFSYYIIFIGIILYFYLGYKKDLKYLYYLVFITVALVFSMSSNQANYDTMLYHHQLVNWPFLNKIPINFVIADIRLGMVSPWQLFLSLFNFKLFNYQVSILINFIPYLFLFLIAINSINIQKKSFSDYFIIISTFFILVFSIIHPFGNGIIMMHIGSLETDSIAMIFFILSFFFFLKFYENKKEKKYFDYLLICVILTIFCRFSYLPVFILPIFILFIEKHFQKNKIIILFSIFVFSLWIIRNLLVTGCLVFPINQLCLGFDQFIETNKVENYLLTIKSFARSAPERLYFQDHLATINSLKWFKPWFFGYFLKTSLIQISLITSFISLLIIYYLKKNNNFKTKNSYIIHISLIICFLIWLQAPDVRFLLGFFILLPSYLFSICIIRSKIILSRNFLINTFLVIIIMLTIKNFQNYKFVSLFKYFERDYDYSELKIIKKEQAYTIFKSSQNNGFCYDRYGICIDKDKVEFDIINHKGWNYFKKK